VLKMIGNFDQYLRYQENGGKEAKTHSDEMSIHLGCNNLCWFGSIQPEMK